ncbi:MAG TPA: 3D domain-containing protein [Gemmatimonadaceae bacterium]|jgi:3D (Asp-Asp-Asp) domain-containing protein|nr:3D domain-containing protein [Gemmatimonadaceae bacterium]
MSKRPQRRLGTLASLGPLSAGLALATLALGVVIAFGIRDDQRAAVHARAAAEAAAATPVPRVAPLEPIPVDGIVVLAATKTWTKTMHRPIRAGEPVPVLVTAYCLSGTTRRGRYVRPGIVAADRGLFPLSRYIELYAGEKYLGRFLIDDTGGKIRGAHIDVWVPTCRQATLFGRQHGTAMLLPRPEVQIVQAGTAK